MRRVLSRRWLATLLSVAISAALLGFLLSRLDFVTAWSRLRHANLAWLCGAALCSFVVLLARGARIAVLVPQAGFVLTAAAVSQQQFLNRVTPLRLGELSLPWHLSRHCGESAVRSLVHVVVVRLVDLALVLATATLALVLRSSLQRNVALALVPALLLTVAAILLLRPILRGFHGIATRALRHVASPRLDGIRAQLEKLRLLIDDGLVLRPAQHAFVGLLSCVVLGVQTLLFGSLLAAFDVPMGPLALLQGACVAQLGGALPVASVGTVGTQEASWVVGFTWVGVSLDDAIVTGIACQIITLAFAACHASVGAMILARRSRSLP